MELPRFIPIFPLPNVVLFPDVPLPLHIFEARYRTMVRDALTGSRLIGMTLLRPGWEAEYTGAPEVYRIGCAGRITESATLPDGRLNILLAGVREFEIVSEQRERVYRQASVVWRPAATDAALDPALRAALVRTIDRYSGREGAEGARKLLHDATLTHHALVNLFACWLDLSPIEKQSILEESGLEPRARRLVEILEFHCYAAETGDPEIATRRMH